MVHKERNWFNLTITPKKTQINTEKSGNTTPKDDAPTSKLFLMESLRMKFFISVLGFGLGTYLVVTADWSVHPQLVIFGSGLVGVVVRAWVERPRITITRRSCMKSSVDAKVHAKAVLCRSACSILPPSRAEAGYAQSRTVDTHHTENKCGGRGVVGPARLSNIPSSPTGVRQRNTVFGPD